MVMKTIGRKTGKIRYVPVNYTIWKGKIYCLSGGREAADWFKNLICNSEIDVIMPGGAVYGHVECPYLGEERFTVIKQILRNAGFAGFFEGYNPYTIGDEELSQKTSEIPVIQITPVGLGSGPSDAEGWGWITWMIIGILVILGIVLLVP